MKKKKICVITGTRAEYGLLYWIMKYMKEYKNIDFKLIVTGMHLSKKFGNTHKEIVKDGFAITSKVPIQIIGDSQNDIIKAVSQGITGFSKVFIKLNPDLVVVLGDRYEIFAAVISASFLNIPIAHFHGGESTEGAIDEAIRHSITKMSHLHFVSTLEYKKRVIQLGEDPRNVFLVGSMGIDNIKKLKLLSKKNLEKEINYKFKKKNFLVTFHPVTLENKTSKQYFKNLLKALDKFKEIGIIFTKPNSDSDNNIISKMIDSYVNKNKLRSVSFISLGNKKYLSTMQFVDCIIGNSSSGILEAPSFKIATINIGDRQKGRIMSKSVINCTPEKDSIISSIKKIYSSSFKKRILKSKNPYDYGSAALKSFKIINKHNLENLLKKKFYRNL